MSLLPHRDASFVVRIWWERMDQGQVYWRGEVVHSLSRQSIFFDNLSTLVAFLERWVGGELWSGENSADRMGGRAREKNNPNQKE